MSISAKILIFLGVMLTLGVASFIVYKQVESSNRLTAIETQIIAQKQLVDGITRSMNQYSTKEDIEQFIKDNKINLKAIQDDLSVLHAEIIAVNITKTNSTGTIATNVPSTNTGPTNPNSIPTVNCNGTQLLCPDQYGYLKLQQNLDLAENFSNVKVPIGTVGFSAWKKEPWSINILPRTYNNYSVIATDENQRHYVYNKFSVDVGGKTYDININNATTKEQYPDPKLSWWNPRLFMNANFLANVSQLKPEISPGISIGFMSYGRYKNAPDWSFLQVGASYGLSGKKVALNIQPVNFNVGKLVPWGIANNTYIGPSFQVSTSADVFIGGGVSIGF